MVLVSCKLALFWTLQITKFKWETGRILTVLVNWCHYESHLLKTNFFINAAANTMPRRSGNSNYAWVKPETIRNKINKATVAARNNVRICTSALLHIISREIWRNENRRPLRSGACKALFSFFFLLLSTVPVLPAFCWVPQCTGAFSSPATASLPLFAFFLKRWN